MPKGIHPLLTADLLHALASMGHGDEIAIVDANSPAARLARHAFYERASRATAILRTGELRPYGNILLVKGVVNRYEPAP